MPLSQQRSPSLQNAGKSWARVEGGGFIDLAAHLLPGQSGFGAHCGP